MKTKYDPKFLAKMAAATVLSIALSFLLVRMDHLIFAFLFGAGAIRGCVAVFSHLSYPSALQKKVLQLLKNNGGELELEKIYDYFLRSSPDNPDAVDRIVPILLTELEKKGMVRTTNGMIQLVT